MGRWTPEERETLKGLVREMDAIKDRLRELLRRVGEARTPPAK